jgi:hypothetical protein
MPAGKVFILISIKPAPPWDHRPWFTLAGGRKVEAPMTYSSLGSERLFLADPTDSRICRDPTELDRIIAALTAPELLVVAVFCALGLAVTVALCFLIPSFGEFAASVQTYS